MNHIMFMHRLEADYLEQISITKIKHKGYLQEGINCYGLTWGKDGEISFSINLFTIIKKEEQYVAILYLGRDEPHNQQTIQLTTTYCNYGGKRYWFICPCCARQCGVIYYRASRFACRVCQHLTYVSKNVSGVEKSLGRIKSEKELDLLKSKVKRKWYAGKMTKSYRRYLGAKHRQSLILRTFCNEHCTPGLLEDMKLEYRNHDL